MTGLALVAIASGMSILQAMAGGTGRCQVLVTFAGMAGGARDVLVGPVKGEFRFAVIECLDAAPTILAMAAIALFTEPLLVRVLRLVTVVAASRGAAERHRHGVASVAAYCLVAAFEFEIGGDVVEGLAIELDDIGGAALVIGMTVLAILAQGVCVAAVKTATVATIGSDVLVTGDTETRLRLPGKWLVAALALFLKLGMSGNQGSRHDELLENILRAGAPAHRDGDHPSDPNRPCQGAGQWQASRQ